MACDLEPTGRAEKLHFLTRPLQASCYVSLERHSASRACTLGAILPAHRMPHSRVLKRELGTWHYCHAVKWPQRKNVPVPMLPVLEAQR